MKNVIDITRRLGKSRNGKDHAKNQAEKGASENASEKASVVDMTEMRNEIINQERRKVKRTLLSEFISAFALVPRKGLLKVTLSDISVEGAAVDITMDAGHFEVGEEVAMRVYLNHQTYFPFVVKVQNIRGRSEDGVFRHGVHFLKDSANDEALFHLIRFIETVSASLKTDQGDIQVSSLMR